MANVIICDRCGKRVKDLNADQNFVLMRVEYLSDTKERDFLDPSFKRIRLDLCEKCLESLAMWVAEPTSPYGGDGV